VVGPEVLVISAHPGGLRLGEPQDVVDEEVGRADRSLDLRLDVAGYVAGLVGQGVASAPAGTPGTTTRTLRHDEVDRAVTVGRTAGFSRLVLDRRAQVVGATVVGPRAGEVLAELALAIRHGLRARDLAGVMHAYPTWADGPWNAAIAEVRQRLAAPVPHRLLRIVAGTRRLLDRRG
jgi:Pyridine nucleotide-disulphide oxidoreductase, dimerisation domain